MPVLLTVVGPGTALLVITAAARCDPGLAVTDIEEEEEALLG
jgi:hypothetical protein